MRAPIASRYLRKAKGRIRSYLLLARAVCCCSFTANYYALYSLYYYVCLLFRFCFESCAWYLEELVRSGAWYDNYGSYHYTYTLKKIFITLILHFCNCFSNNELNVHIEVLLHNYLYFYTFNVFHYGVLLLLRKSFTCFDEVGSGWKQLRVLETVTLLFVTISSLFYYCWIDPPCIYHIFISSMFGLIFFNFDKCGIGWKLLHELESISFLFHIISSLFNNCWIFSQCIH